MELRSLCAWLVADRGVRRHTSAELMSTAAEAVGHQGTALDVLSVVLSSGFSAASLAMSIAQWRSTRPQPPTLIIERPDGTKIEISGSSTDEAAQAVQRLLGE
ncbi:hypothetical protein ACGF4C_20435 [Streptomyces sp. NPDC048197]|uniref:effector-associated constant component EACC1 n=1 Tax=Streptomyces sp. NPDC048197 TaxID=3365511 RepID=UPI003714290D